jgi:polyhydroxybutyrate depolymerase
LTKSRFNQLADEKGFIVVYPNAVKRNWNDGRLTNLKPGMAFVDDVGFISNIVAKVRNEYNIDSKRIFTTGMSNGGFMSSRLLCDRSDIFRGGAILTATISVDYIDKCTPEYPVGVMIMNGTGDPLVPYTGGQVKVFKKERGEIVSTDDFVAYWAGVLCNSDAHTSQDLPDYNAFDGSTVNVKTFTDCKENTALVRYKIKGGGHTWPGGKQYLGKKIIGTTNRDINACEVIWTFFESLPERN